MGSPALLGSSISVLLYSISDGGRFQRLADHRTTRIGTRRLWVDCSLPLATEHSLSNIATAPVFFKLADQGFEGFLVDARSLAYFLESDVHCQPQSEIRCRRSREYVKRLCAHQTNSKRCANTDSQILFLHSTWAFQINI